MTWTGDLQAGDRRGPGEIRQHRQKLVFVDFTGETCTNCKLNEREVFTKKEIRDLLTPFRRVQLYTDKVPDEYYRLVGPEQVSRTRRGSGPTRWRTSGSRTGVRDEQLPLYVILRPTVDGRIERVGVYDEGKINNVGAFAEFLKKPLGDMAQPAFEVVTPTDLPTPSCPPHVQ